MAIDGVDIAFSRDWINWSKEPRSAPSYNPIKLGGEKYTRKLAEWNRVRCVGHHQTSSKLFLVLLLDGTAVPSPIGEDFYAEEEREREGERDVSTTGRSQNPIRVTACFAFIPFTSFVAWPNNSGHWFLRRPISESPSTDSLLDW